MLCLQDAGLTGHKDDAKDTGCWEKAGTPWSYCRVVPYFLDRQSGETLLRSGAQKGQYREDASVIVGGVVQAELGQDAADVGLDGLRAQQQGLAMP